jgi:hypothetical protein
VPSYQDREAAVRERAERQRGVIVTPQLRELGAYHEWVARRVRSGTYERLFQGAYAVIRADDRWSQRAYGALLLLGPDAVLSHSSAARVHELSLPRSLTIEVTIPARHRTRRESGLCVRYTRHLPYSDRVNKRGFRVTSVARTLVDLAPRLSRDDLEQVLDEAFGRRLIREQDLDALLNRPSSQRRAGTGMLREALVPWKDGTGRVESVPEMSVARFLRRAGIPDPVRQYEVLDPHGDFVARVDLAWPQQRVVVEVESYRYHSSPQSFARDSERRHRLEALGWIVIRVTPAELRDHPEPFLAALRTALGNH